MSVAKSSSTLGFKLGLIFTGALLIGAILFYALRPKSDTNHPTSIETRASGRCASCHFDLEPQIVDAHNRSVHAAKGLNCIDCHFAAEGQRGWSHKEFEITERVTAKNCAKCHDHEYQAFLRSGHSLPAWAAVHGKDGMDAELIGKIEAHHPGILSRQAATISDILPVSSIKSGCEGCHKIGRPNEDGSVGSCTECHSAHRSSKALAAQPETCGRCHSGADHAQFEIYSTSKHGVIHDYVRRSEEVGGYNPLAKTSLDAPTCVTCHMGKIGDQNGSHDISDRLAMDTSGAESKARANDNSERKAMQTICMNCHASTFVQGEFRKAEKIEATVDQLLGEMLTDVMKLQPMQNGPDQVGWNSLQYEYFEAWHHFGKAAKHGAFMGSPGHVMWRGVYEVQKSHDFMRERAQKAAAATR